MRVAVGAAPRDLIWVVAQHTLRLVALGAGIGPAVTFGLSRLVRAGGGAGSIWDLAFQALAIPVAMIVVIGLIATWLPARRAAGADPATLLRADYCSRSAHFAEPGVRPGGAHGSPSQCGRRRLLPGALSRRAVR